MMRIRSYQQLESSDCAITCIRILARYYGKKISPKYLRSLSDSSRQGLSVGDIISILTKLGFYNTCVKTTVEALEEMPLPAILYWNNAHFIVLYKIHKNRYFIVDPAQGKIGTLPFLMNLPMKVEYGMLLKLHVLIVLSRVYPWEF